jgi:hypothetical protein
VGAARPRRSLAWQLPCVEFQSKPRVPAAEILKISKQNIFPSEADHIFSQIPVRE